MPISKKTNSKASVSAKIQDIQKKIEDDTYVASAIDRIASVVSRHIAEGHPFTEKTAEILIQ